MVKVSIIVPIYNVEKYLKRCIESLINQTMKDIEIILVDDGSQDKSLEICKEYEQVDKRIRIYSKKNEGLGLTRNFGLERASGEYIAFVDSDDYVTLDMCEKLYNSAIELNADVVYGNHYFDTGSRIIEKKNIYNAKKWTKNQIRNLILDFIATEPNEKKDTIMEVSVWKALFKKETILNNNIRFVSERKFISEDVIFDIDFLSKSKIVVAIPDYVYYYCLNPNSLSKKYREDRFKKEKELYYEIKRKLLEIGYTEKEIEIRTDRLLIARARVNTFQIFRCANQNDKKLTLKLINEICNDQDLNAIFNRYNYKKLPFKHKLIIYLQKNKIYFMLSIISNLT